MYSGYQSLIRYMIYKYSLAFCGLSFHSLDNILGCTKNFNFDVVQYIYFFFSFLCF